MMTTIDKAGRVLIPAAIRKRLGLEPGTVIDLQVEGLSLRLVRAVPGPELIERRGRLLTQPRVPEGKRPAVEVARLIEEERERWPGWLPTPSAPSSNVSSSSGLSAGTGEPSKSPTFRVTT